MDTAQIIASTRESPIHLRTAEELKDVWVSSFSRWYDRRWIFDNPTHGADHSLAQVNWERELDNGTLLTDATNDRMLDWLRRLAWSLTSAPGDGKEPLAPGSMQSFSLGLGYAASWMVSQSIRMPSQITPAALDHFVSDLPRRLARSGAEEDEGDFEDREVSKNVARKAIMVFIYLWRQRNVLRSAGIEPMPFEPWGGKAASALADQISDQVQGWIQPIPDDAAVLILNSAMGFVDERAVDILRLRDEAEAAFERGGAGSERKGGQTPQGKLKAQVRAVSQYRFSQSGDGVPWHPGIYEDTSVEESPPGLRRLKYLLDDLAGACCIGLMAFTGMRVSELCGLRGGRDSDTGLNKELQVEIAPSGLFERFVIRGELSKQQSSPREVPWLVGLRRASTHDYPAAVRCLEVMDKLMAPYQALCASERLMLNPYKTFPRIESDVGKMTGRRVNYLCRGFINRRVDLSELPDESANAIEPNDLAQWREQKGGAVYLPSA